jgi:hypothetical protein
MSRSQRRRFQTAFNYLRRRSQHLRYHSYREAKVPIGSGVTEAGGKTLFTQRLKLSGMRWSKEGALVILNLRAIRLSGVWKAVHRAMLRSISIEPGVTPVPSGLAGRRKAA